jgi:hypothetical protein
MRARGGLPGVGPLFDVTTPGPTLHEEDKPRADLNRPWRAIVKRAALTGPAHSRSSTHPCERGRRLGPRASDYRHHAHTLTCRHAGEFQKVKDPWHILSGYDQPPTRRAI